ncbi:MAG: aspartate carbamoyltransferase regulatory subunit [Thermoplasmataceae archaeon]|jgi:aspartate carbamoyltransferase regulatory subunit
MDKTLLIAKIKDGTVIDHISSGKSFKVLSILNIDSSIGYTVTVAVHVPSKKTGFKDIVKIEGRFLEKEELDRISLAAPNAAISIIRNYDITEKFHVEIPDEITGIIDCPNQNCISNAKEPVKARFLVRSKNPLSLKCYYCERLINENEILQNL